MWVTYCMLLVAMATGQVWGQSTCDTDSCASTDVALMDAGNTDVNRNYYIGGMFDVHDQGANPYTCGPVNPEGIINMEAFFWAIGEYSKILNDVHVGGFGMDSCSRPERAVENAYSFETCRTYYTNVNPYKTVAFVGPSTNYQAIDTALLFKDMLRTQVSSGASAPELSDNKYSNFLRTVPSDAVEAMVIAKVLNREAVKYVQVLVEDNMYGNGLKYAFMEAAKMYNICIVQSAMIGSNAAELRNFLKAAEPTGVVVLLAGKEKARFVLESVNDELEVQNKFFFVGTSAWGTDPAVIRDLDQQAITLKLNTDEYPNDNDVDRFWTRFFQWRPDTGSSLITANVNTHNPWFAELWQQVFNCRFDTNDINRCNVDNQNLNTSFTDKDMYKNVANTLLAVKAIIRGVKAASNEFCQNDHVCSGLLNPQNTRGGILYEKIKNATDEANRYFFKANGDAADMYEKYQINLVRENGYIPVMTYDASRAQVFEDKGAVSFLPSACNVAYCTQCNEMPPATTRAPTQATTAGPAIDYEAHKPEFIRRYKAELLKEWRNEVLNETFLLDQEFTGVWRRDQVRADEDWLTRFEKGQDWIIALGVCAGLGIVCVLVFEIYILYRLMGTKLGKQWRTMWLGQLLLFGIFLAYLVCFAYLWTPSRATCGITRFGVGVSYAMCFAVLLVKLMVLLTSKTSADSLLPGDVDSPNYLRGIYQFLMYLFIVGVQVVIDIQWLIMVPPDAVQVESNNGDMVWICNHYTWSLEQEDSWMDMKMFIRTNFENHLISLVYVMFLVVLTVIIAMKSHGIITNHRESVFIGISAGFSVPVFIAWGLVGGLNKQHQYAQEFGDASFAFGLLIVATIILFAMFLPKVRQLVNMGVEGIYLEDDRDTYYAGSVVMAPPSYKSRPSSVVYVNGGGSYNDPVILGDNAVHLKHPGSNYSAPVFVKRPDSTIGGGSGKVLRMTGDLTGKHPRDNRKSTSEVGYAYAGSGYGTYRKSRSESGGTLRKAHSTQDLGAL